MEKKMEKMADLIEKISRDPSMVTSVFIGSVQLKNKGNTALTEGKFENALQFFKEALALVEPAFGYDAQESCDCLIGMTECFIGMKQLSIAEEHAKRLMNIAKKYDNKEDIETAQDLLNEIEKAKNGESANEKSEKINPNCVSCNTKKAKFHCGACKEANYCSQECQRRDWPKHKLACSAAQLKPKSAGSAASNTNANETKPACGLCGSTGSRTVKIGKTDCCKKWICMDYGNYELSSFRLNSCHRNHQRYSLCTSHHEEKHSGALMDCTRCKMDMRERIVGQCDEEIEWTDFCFRHFYFENVGEKERKRNLELKKDNTKARLYTIPF